MIVNKQCSYCNKVLPNTLEYFHTNKSYKDKLQPYCKECAKKRAREYESQLTTEQHKAREKRKQLKAFDKKYVGHKDFRVVVYTSEGKRTFVIGTTKYTSSKYFGGAKIPHKGEFDLIVLGRVRGTKIKQYICKFTNSPLFLTPFPSSCKNKMRPTANGKGYTGYGTYRQSTHKKEHGIWSTLIHSTIAPTHYLCNMQYFIDYVKTLPAYNTWLNQKDNTLVFNTELLTFTDRSFFKPKVSPTKPIGTLNYKKSIICDCCGVEKPWNDETFPRVASHILELQTTCKECNRKKTIKKYRDSIYTPEVSQQKAEAKELARQKRLIRDLMHYKAPKKRKVRPTHKVCPNCNEEFPFDLEYFSKASDRFWGLDYLCKGCRQDKRRLKRKNLTEVQKQKQREASVKRAKKPVNKIHRNLSRAISKQLNKLDEYKNGVPSAEYIGCSFTELKEHLNKGKYTVEDYARNTVDYAPFNIDHIIPKAYFTDELQEAINNEDALAVEAIMKRCWNYKNLRVLDTKTNVEKSDTLDLELIEEYGITDLL